METQHSKWVEGQEGKSVLSNEAGKFTSQKTAMNLKYSLCREAWKTGFPTQEKRKEHTMALWLVMKKGKI